MVVDVAVEGLHGGLGKNLPAKADTFDQCIEFFFGAEVVGMNDWRSKRVGAAQDDPAAFPATVFCCAASSMLYSLASK